MSVTLWTIQHPGAWADLQNIGVYRADPDHQDEDFRDISYPWMKEQFKKRVPEARGLTLIWAWKTPKPDLRSHRWFYPKGMEMVRIEFEAPEDLILVSDYDMWHNVLNRFFVPLCREEEEHHWNGRDTLLDTLLDQGLSRRDAHERVRKHFSEKTHESWERIFDLEAMSKLMEDPYYGGSSSLPYHQVVFEELPLEWVKKVDHFKGAQNG